MIRPPRPLSAKTYGTEKNWGPMTIFESMASAIYQTQTNLVCMLDCHYDEKNLYFRIKTYDDELIIENGPIKAPKEHYYDTLEIHYMDPNHAHVEQYIAIHFGIQQRSPVLYLRNAYNIISSSKYEYQLHYFETGYELEIALNKELFGGNIENGLRIEFIIHDIDIKPPLFRCANRWSSSLLHGIPDPTTYAKLVMQ